VIVDLTHLEMLLDPSPPGHILYAQPSHLMISLPEELWLHVLHFLSIYDLYRVRGVNRLFLDSALREKYHHFKVGEIIYRYRGIRAIRYLEHIRFVALKFSAFFVS
jgi:hypothetical protein